MKKIIVVISLMAASLLYSAAALSAEKSPELSDSYDQYKGYEMNGQKDECLIVAKNCTGGDDTAFKRAERLNREIEKGAAVYTPEELKSFLDQLNWIYYESGDFPAVRL